MERKAQRLSKREQEILYRLARRLSNEEIADELHLALSSVKWYVRQLLNKLGADNRREAVKQARAQGWLKETGSLYAQTAEDQSESPNNLPFQTTSFIGRVDEIQKINHLLSKHRLVTLTGAGGVGKTSLALCIARQQVDSFLSGVWLVELASLSDPALVNSTVADALGLNEVPGVPILDTMIAYLKNRRLLLVIDNCEHLLLACAFLVEELLKKCSHLDILATSREFLNLPGEMSFRVPSLPVPDLRYLPPLAQLAQVDAVRLFVERANQVMPGFALDEANAQDVVTITHRLDGIPLAIELAAACVRTMPVSQVNSRLDRAFILLTGGTRTAPPRQQTLKATIDWSYALLSEKERMFIQRLSVFSGGWTLEAAEAMCADCGDRGESAASAAQAVCVGEEIGREEILPLLSLLVDKSLIIRIIFIEGVPTADRDFATRSAGVTPGTGRYRMLETIRQYSRDRLLATESEEALRDRHLRYYCQWCEAVEPHLIGEEQMHWMDCLEGELDNLRLALEWSLHDQVDEGLRLAASLEYFWKNRSHWMEGRHWLESLLNKEAENREGQPLHAGTDRTADLLLWMKSYNALISLFNAYSGSPNAHRWVALLPESIRLCQQMGEVASLELVKVIISNASNLFWRGDSEKAIALLEEILLVCQQKQFLFEETNTTYLLGYFSMLIGEMQKGQAWLETALALARQLELPDLIASCLAILGVTVGFNEDQARGKALLEEGLEIFWTIGNLQEYHWNSVLLLHFCQDRQAIQRAKTAYNYYQDTRNDNRLIWTFANLIYAEWSNGQTKNAEKWGQKAFSFVSSDPQLKTLNLRNHSFIFLWLARLAFTRGDISQARRHIQTTLLWFENAGRFLAFDYTHFLDFLAVLFTATGDYSLAARLFGAASEMYCHYRIGLGARLQSEHEEAELRLQDVLAKETFTDAWEEGQAMTIVQAVQLAITALNENKSGPTH
jgi:predicted ATPase/DNA-binding CsgD family transcriptional regulator